MSPRGYYSKESINPYFTSEGYKYTEAYKAEVEAYTKFENRLRSLKKYPQKVVVWLLMLYNKIVK
jgi:hypothetical protein